MTANRLRQPQRIAGGAGEEVADLGVYLTTPIDAADGLNRQHGAQPGPVAQGIERRRLGADKDAASDQAAMAVIDGIEGGSAPGAALEAVGVEMASHRLVRVALVRLEHQEIIR